MPTIPSYLTPQVAPTAAPTVYDKTDTRGTHGEQLAGVVKGAGEMVYKIAAEEKAKADTAAILQAESDYRRTLNGLWADPAKGLSNFKGAEFAGKDVEALKSSGDVRTKIQAGLKNDTQRQEFARRADSHSMAFEEQVNRYSVQQRDYALGQTVDTSIKEALDEAAINYDDESRRASVLRGMDETIAVKAKLMGLDETGRKRLEKELAGQASASILHAYIKNGRAAEAREFFEDNKESLGVKAADYEASINAAETRTGALKAATALWEQAKGDPLKASELAREAIKDDEKFGKVREQLENFAEDKRKADDQRLARVFMGIRNSEPPGTLDDSDPDFQALDDVGKSKAMDRAATIKRQSRPKTTESNKWQTEQNRIAKRTFMLLSDAEQMDVEQSVEAVAKMYPNADDATLLDILLVRKRTEEDIGKGNQTHRQDLDDRIGRLLVGKKKEEAAEIRAWAREQYNRVKDPTREDIDKIVARAGAEKVLVPRKLGPIPLGQKEVPVYRAPVQVPDPGKPATVGDIGKKITGKRREVTRVVGGATYAWRNNKWVAVEGND